VIPAAFFGIVLGLAGLGGAWRAAHQVWQTPAIVGEALMAVAAIVWLLVSFLFILKWIYAWEEALDEAQDPVQCGYIGLAGVATMLIAAAARGYSRLVAEVLFGIGALFTLAFAAWRTGALWYGEREQSTNTPVLYLPAVAGGFVTATVASALGYPEWGQLAFGVGLFSWLAIESVLLHRLYTATSLTAPLRPTLGIQLAPPAVGAVAYLSVNGGNPDLIAHALIGYALMQLLIMLRLLPWITQQSFAASYWAFTFGITSLAATIGTRAVGGFNTSAAVAALPSKRPMVDQPSTAPVVSHPVIWSKKEARNTVAKQSQADRRGAEPVLTFNIEPEPGENAGVEYRIEEDIGVGPASSKTSKAGRSASPS